MATTKYSAQQRYRERNRELCRQRQRDHYSRNSSRIVAKQKKYSIDHPEKILLIASKNRAKTVGLEHTIVEGDIVIPPICPILKIPLQKGSGKIQDSSPTLDRIDSSKGYIPGNVQVISGLANRLKNNATFEQLIAMGEWAKNQSI